MLIRHVIRRPLSALLSVALTGGLALAPPEVASAGVTALPQAAFTRFPIGGIDSSHYEHQGSFDWTAVARGGPKFVSLKATEGVGYVDPWFAGDLAAARREHLIVTAYHFFDPDEGGAAQARHFLDVVRAHGLAGTHRYELPYVLDLEKAPHIGCGGTAAALQSQILAFIRQIETVSRPPIIYTQRTYVNECLGGSTALGGYRLWLAGYADQAPPPIPGSSGWNFWQYSDSGHATGISHVVDLDVFSGSYDQLKALADVN